MIINTIDKEISLPQPQVEITEVEIKGKPGSPLTPAPVKIIQTDDRRNKVKQLIKTDHITDLRETRSIDKSKR